jgi:Rrf2 family iron-sulfur cluster assembly transcriptional regulator
MRLSRKARFGITAMIRLGLREGRGTKTLSDLSMDQGISLSYLEQLFAQLRRSGLVVGVRGPGGGYRLARPADEIPLSEIITAVDDQAYKQDAVNGDKPTDLMWREVSRQLYGFLGELTLGDVLRGCPADATNDEHYHRYLNEKVA